MSSRRSKNNFVVAGVLVNAFLLVLPLLSFSPAVGPAAGSRLVDSGFLGAQLVTSFTATLPAGALSSNTTLQLPLNSTATVVSASVTITGVPSLPYTNITGYGGATRDGENFGQGLEGEGDYNNDGFNDLAAGADISQTSGQPGRVDVFWGSASGYGRSANWSYNGPINEGFGWSLTHGDYNHDGIADLVVGESGNFGLSPEHVYIFFGNSSGLPAAPSLNLSAPGPAFGQWGEDVVGGLDLNNDSYDELLVGEPLYIRNGNVGQGRVTVFWGQAAGLNLSSSTFLYGAGIDAAFGFALRNLGDTDNDGADEFAVGSYGLNAFAGRAQVYEGEDSTTNLTERWNITGTGADYFGYSLSGGQNITGDANPDLAVGAPVWQMSNGTIYIYEGLGNATYSTTPTVILAPSSNGIEQFGVSHDMVGDLNGDGTNDFVVGANAYPNNGFDGRVYVWAFGNLGSNGPLVFEANHTGDAESVGWRVVRMGDVDHDGFADFAVDNVVGWNTTTTPGSVRAYYGRQHILPEDIKIYVDTTQVYTHPGALFGSAVALGFQGALQNYINTHPGQANATGIIRTPLSFNFSNSGALSVGSIQVRYSYVAPPPNVRISAPAVGRSLTIAWDLHATDATVFDIWSNRTGNWSLVGTASFPRTSFTDLNLTDGQRYYYYVTESDASAALTSAASPIVSAIPQDITPPETPRNFTVNPFQSNHSAFIVWSPDDTDVDYYEVLRQAQGESGFSVVGAVPHPGSSFLDTGLLEELAYNYSVRAVDLAGLRSNQTLSQSFTLPDTVPPPQVQNVRAATAPSGEAIDVAWDANLNDTVAYAVYLSLSNGTAGMVDEGRATGTAFTVTGLSRNATYWVAVKAVDKVSHLSPFSDLVEVLTVDTQAPAPPVITGVSVQPEGNRVRLNWTASDTDISGFTVSTNVTGAWTTAAAFQGAARNGIIDNLTDGTLYYFRIAAFDFGGRIGNGSAAVSATPRDTLRPVPPTAIQVTPIATGSALDISWTPSTDPDVAHYTVWYLDPTASSTFSLAATLPGTAHNFTHTGLKNGVTYSYEVHALDEVPNESPPSARQVGVPRDTVPPAAPKLDALPSRTNTVALQVSGTADEGMEVQVYLNGALRQKVTAGAGGRFTVQLSLAQGDNAVVAHAVDTDPSVEPNYRTGPDSATAHVILDTADPTIASATPPDGSSGIPTGQKLTVVFSEAVDPASVVVTLKDAAGATVAGNATVDPSGTSVSFQPTAPLKEGEHYTLSVTAKDDAGNEMPAQSIGFTTSPPQSNGGGGGLPGLSAGAAALSMAGAALAVAAVRRRKR